MWNNLPWRFRFPVYLLLISCSAFAQKADTRRFPLEQINVNGSQRYTVQAIIAATGLRAGQQTSQDQLEKVSQKLGASGLFSLVEFRFGWGTKGVVATFNVTDSTKLVPIGFENLVWFSSNELTTEIKKKLPLFTGVIPLAGDYRDQVAGALHQVLAEHNLHGTVTALPQGAAGQITAMLFRVEGHEIRVTSCEFPGTDHGNQLEFHELAKYIMAMSYDKSFVDQSIETRLKDSYDALGYLNARSQTPELRVVSSSPERTEIALTTRVDEGHQYRVSSFGWSGNTLFTQAQLEKAMNFPAGQVASIPNFRKALYSVRKVYQGVGYLGANLEFEPKLSPDGTAHFDITVMEGSQYTMGSLKFVGVDPVVASRASADWQMKPGSPYNPSYPINFMSHFKFFPNGRCDCRNREVTHDDSRTVDVQIEAELKQ